MNAQNHSLPSPHEGRQRHRKSRHGCAECKRRRVKCDETHPACKRCTAAGRECSFSLLQPGLPQVGAASTTSPDESTDRHPVVAESVAPAHAVQAQLLHHFTSSHDAIFPRCQLQEETLSANFLTEQALTCPYLLNEILALSARHLATCWPDRKAAYFHYAKAYQTHALSLITESNIQLDEDNHLQVLFFSWLLGIHLLCDVSPDGHTNDTLSRFVEWLDVYRGVRTITAQAWQSLLRTGLQRTINQAVVYLNRTNTDAQASCVVSARISPVVDLIRGSLGLTEAQKVGCDQALASLKSYFDTVPQGGPEDLEECIYTILSWPLIVDTEFLSSVRQKRPEALIVVAHFAILLHWHRSHWIIGKLGYHLYGGLVACLGPGWERWLQWPESVINT